MKNKKLKQRNTAQSRRRGIAIEMTMLFMLVVVALSALAVSLAMMQNERHERTQDAMEQRMVLEQIGEDFCLLQGGYALTGTLAQEYDTTVIDSGSTVTLRVYPRPVGADTKSVLTVELTLKDGEYTVTEWSYGE